MSDFAVFAREADDRARAVERRILPGIEKAITLSDPVQHIYEVLRPEFERTYETPGLSEFVSVRRTTAGAWAWFTGTIDNALSRLKPASDADDVRSQAERLASWLGVATVNGALVAAGQTEQSKRWTSQHDDRVRHFHVEADGQTVLMSKPFTVCNGRKMLYPAQPIGDPDCWINCRCFVVPVHQEAAAVSTTTTNQSANLTWVNPGTTTITYNPSLDLALQTPTEEVEFAEPDMADLDVESAIGDTLTPWHAVFAPEGVASGDGRRFSQDALSWRDLPLPLKWQKVDAEGHGGSVIVGRIDNMFREGNLILGDGVFLATEEADDLIGMMAEKAVRGISVDVDSAELSVADDEEFTGTEFAKGRISSATVVSIPAFSEAYIALGERPDHVPVDDAETDDLNGNDDFRDVSAEERKGLEKEGKAMPGGGFPIANCDDLKNAIQAIGRAKDPAAARAHIKKRAAALNCGIDLPKDWDADTEDFGPVPRGPGDKRGPGWVTAPKATQRIHHYWTRGEGAAKIGWGAPGDFNRCKRQLAKYISAPYLNRTCAEWHFDALGYWPAQHKGRLEHSLCVPCGGAESQGNAEPRDALLDEGGPSRAERVLAVDGGQDHEAARVAGGSSLRNDHGRPSQGRQDVPGASAGMGVPGRADPRGSDHRPSVRGETVHECAAPGTCDCRGEHPATVAAAGTPSSMSAGAPEGVGEHLVSPTHSRRRGAGEVSVLPHLPQGTAVGEVSRSVNLVASATTAYPMEMFANPGFSSHMPLDVYEFSDGLYGVRGHLAAWGTCHIGLKGVCTTAPRSATDYRMFRTGLVRLSDGGTMPVGQITMNCGHADLNASYRSAAAHYDNTGAVVADVNCGEDDHGIWIAGVIRPGVTEEQRTVLQASALSGDWRNVAGNLELVAALCVNTPGFPVPRVGLAASAGEQTALVAAGVVCAGCGDQPSDDDLTVAQARKIIGDMRASRAARIMEDIRFQRLEALSDI